jgi:hypothetical protein
MGRSLRCAAFPLLLCAVAVSAQERMAVLEFFGRPNGQFCREAGPAMLTLQAETSGRAILLEYDYDRFATGRVSRFWAARPSAVYLPLVMAGSGYRTSTGQVDYERDYRAMIEAELARSPEAAVGAYWRRFGDAVRAYVRVTNLSASPLTTAEEGAIWVVAWENARIGVSDTWVRGTAFRALTESVAPGATLAATVDTASLAGADWERISSVALVERRPGGAGAYDMLQAAVAEPAALAASPVALTLTAAEPAAEVALAGPYVLTWTAAADVPWLAVSPTAGALPGTATVSLVAAVLPAGGGTGQVRFEAAGDGMSFSATVSVAVPVRVRPPRRRLYAEPPGGRVR